MTNLTFLFVVFVFFIDYSYCQFPELLNFEYGISDAIANTATKHVTCTLSNAQDDGFCMHSFECYARSGAPNWSNACPFGKRCCIFSNSCTNRKIRERISYFTNTNVITSKRLCELIVEPINDNICQYRLDFISFNLMPPENNVCSREYFQVIPDTSRIPHLCGNNDGQHIYVHTNPGGNIQLKMNVAVQTTSNWKIKITQIECPGTNGFWTKHQLNHNITSLLAPVGCTQYFIARSGIVQSFGFNNNAMNIFIQDQHYAICFGKNIQEDSLRLYVADGNVNWPSTTPSTTCSSVSNSNTYLYFPAETISTPATSQSLLSYACHIANGTTLISNTPGPFVIVVKSIGASPQTNGVLGFRFRYSF